MGDLSGAVDLSGAGKTLGPRESAALIDELKAMAQTRELALRDRAATEAENEGLNRLLAALVFAYGPPTEDGGRGIVLTGKFVHEAHERIASFHVSPEATCIRLGVLLTYPGTWEITKREPSEDESLLPVYEELPEVVTRPGPDKVIVQTKRGLRIAEWQPA